MLKKQRKVEISHSSFSELHESYKVLALKLICDMALSGSFDCCMSFLVCKGGAHL